MGELWKGCGEVSIWKLACHHSREGGGARLRLKNAAVSAQLRKERETEGKLRVWETAQVTKKMRGGV